MAKTQSSFSISYSFHFYFKDNKIEQKYNEYAKTSEKTRLYFVTFKLVLTIFVQFILNLFDPPKIFDDNTAKNTITWLSIAMFISPAGFLFVVYKVKSSFGLFLLNMMLYTGLISGIFAYHELLIHFGADKKILLENFNYLFVVVIYISSNLLLSNCLKSFLTTGSLVYFAIRINNCECENEVKYNIYNYIVQYVAIIIFFEVYSFSSELNRREIFKKSELISRTTEFYELLILNSKTPIAIFKEGKLWKQNKEMEVNIKYFPFLFSNELMSKSIINDLLNQSFTKIDNDLVRSLDLEETISNNINFEYLGVFKTNYNDSSKYYLVFVSEHSYTIEKEERFMEFQAFDLTNYIQIKVQQDMVLWKNKLLGKLSHEFISPLISIQTIVEQHEDKSCGSSLGVIKNLCEFILLITKQIEDYFFIDSHSETSINLLSNVSFNEALEAQSSTLDALNIMKNQNSCLSKFKIAVHEVNKGTFGLGETSIVLKSNAKAFNMFLFDVLLIFYRISEDKVEVDVYVDRDTKTITCTISCSSSFELNKIKSESESNANYSSYQGLDISYQICRSIASKINIDFDITDEASKIITILRFPFTEVTYSDSLSEANTEIYNQGFYFYKKNEETNENQRILRKSKSSDMPRGISLDSERLRLAYKTTKMISNNLENEQEKSEKKANCKKVILVVDDLQAVRKSIVKMSIKLLDNNYIIEELEDGCEIIERMIFYEREHNKGKVCLILSDEFMDGLKGSEALYLLNIFVKRNLIRSVPFISCTAFNDSTNLDNIQKNNPSQILNKPITVEELKQIFDKFLL